MYTPSHLDDISDIFIHLERYELQNVKVQTGLSKLLCTSLQMPFLIHGTEKDDTFLSSFNFFARSTCARTLRLSFCSYIDLTRGINPKHKRQHAVVNS